MLYLDLTCHIFQILSFISDLCRGCHRIFIIVVIELVNLVQVCHWLQNASSSSMGVTLPLKFDLNWFMTSIFTLQLIPICLCFLWIRNDKRSMPCGIENLACVGPTPSMCLHDQLPLWFYLVFIYLAPLLNFYVILIFKHHLLSPLFQIPNIPPPTQETSNFPPWKLFYP